MAVYPSIGIVPANTWLSWNAMSITASTTATEPVTSNLNNIAWSTWVATTTDGTAAVTVDVVGGVLSDVGLFPPTHDKEWAAKREDGNARALALLLDALSPRQRDEYERMKYITVTGSQQGRYAISSVGDTYGLAADDAATIVAYFCIDLPDDSYPPADSILAKKLLLEADEARFLRIANRMFSDGDVSRLRGRPMGEPVPV